MFAQYLALKAEAVGALLFYRMGDFYELFFEDAALAAAALGITLTKRGQHAGEAVPMCGVPVHAADAYLARLIRAGHRVAIAEQIEAPADARRAGRPVARAIVRIVTAGTLTEAELLDPECANWLAAVAPKGDRIGLAWADVSTGRFQTVDLAKVELGSELARIAPSELIAPEGAVIEGATGFEAAHFRADAAEKRLKTHFGVASLQSFGDFAQAEIAAAGALLAYLDRTARDAIPRLDPPVRAGAEPAMRIDAATRASLDLGRAGLLGSIDRTSTGAGARLLAAELGAPLVDVSAIAERHAMLAAFIDAANVRTRARAMLRGAPDIERALGRLGCGRGSVRDLAAMLNGLELAGSVRAAVAPIARADGGSTPDHANGLLSRTLNEIGFHDSTLSGLRRALGEPANGAATSGDLASGGFIVAGYDPRLDALRDGATGARARIAALEARYREQSGVAGLKVRHNAVLGYHLDAPARAEAALRSAGFDHRQSLAGAVRFGTPELAALAADVAQAGEAALALERAHFDALVAMIVGDAPAIARTAAALARIDVAASLADLAVTQRWVRPIVDHSHAFQIEAGRHPVVEAALAASRAPFVANDCDLGVKRLWLLTGPNMAGKSTFLRQNALIAMLAQMGSYVPARSARIGVVDRLFSRVGASDDLASGRSTFMVEMVETAAILRQATPRSLVILDEVGRGTSTYDGLAIAWSVLEWVHDRIGCRCLFATHYHELAKLADRLDALALKTVRAREWRGDLVFLHEVADGAADKSYGLAVAKLAGVPEPVIARARAVLTRLEAGRPLVTLADDLPLFAAAPAVEPPPDDLRARLGAIDPDALSPREAHEMLRRLVTEAGGNGA